MTGEKPAPKITLKNAYSLETAQDSVELYDKWAETYDDSFAKENDYNTPDLIAELYADRTTDKDAPVLDIGAGTGLVAEGLLKRDVAIVDAFDISEAMLKVADRKGLYRALILGDLNQKLDIADASYGGFTSTGTFTHGHVGPDAIDGLIRIARPGALFVLGIKEDIYENAGFAAKFADLSEEIRDFEIVRTKGYGENAAVDLQASHTAVAVFRKR